MKKDSERVRLLLVDNTESVQNKGFGKAISEGSALAMKNWPHQVFSTIFTCVFLATIVVFFVFAIFLTLVVEFGNRRSTNTTNITTLKDATVPGFEFCKPVTAENFTLVALGYIEAKKQLYNNKHVKNKFYYVIDRPISDQEACAIETSLRLFQEKSFYIIEIEGNGRNYSLPNNNDYFLLLRKHFPNLIKMKAEILTVFEGTPFESRFKEFDDLAILATKVLLVWQYGGTSLSTNVLFTSRQIFDKNEGMCEVDRELLFCPRQCSAYVYQLIRTILNVQKNETNKDKTFFFQKIVDTSVNDYCGNLKLKTTGCIGVNRIKNESVCTYITRGCDFMRMDEWKRKNVDWKNEIVRLCPIIFKHVFSKKGNKSNFYEY